MLMGEHHLLAQTSNRLGVAERNLTRKIQAELEHMEEDSIFFQTTVLPVTPRLDPKGKNFSLSSHQGKHTRPLTIHKDIKIGSLLGRGEFGDVYECISHHPEWRRRDGFHMHGDLVQMHNKGGNSDKSSEPSDKTKWFIKTIDTSFECSEDVDISPGRRKLAPRTDNVDGEEDSDSLFIVNTDLAGGKSTESHRYALKLLRANSQDSSHLWRLGATLDLAREAKFLASLNHPNIIEMHGTVADPGHPEFAIVLEIMVHTLDKAIKGWKDELKQRKHLLLSFAKSKTGKRAFELKRLMVMHDIANAVEYLHVNK
jgi:serine/threonine protein kinase